MDFQCQGNEKPAKIMFNAHSTFKHVERLCFHKNRPAQWFVFSFSSSGLQMGTGELIDDANVGSSALNKNSPLVFWGLSLRRVKSTLSQPLKV